MSYPLSRILPFKLIWESYESAEVFYRRIVLRKGRMESKFHIILKILAYCYFWDRNLIVEPRFRFNRYKPDLISWKKSEIPTKDELIPDLWIECKAVKIKKLIKLSQALPLSTVVWIHFLQPLSRTIKIIQSKKKKYKLASNIQLIGVETSNKNQISLGESIDADYLQWKITQQARGSIEIYIRGWRSDPISIHFHVLSTTIKT